MVAKNIFLILTYDHIKNNITKMKFNDFEWHDAVIKSVIIDRCNPGKIDNIAFKIEFLSGIADIIFTDVFKANFDMNFNMIATESIWDAYNEGEENNMVQKVYEDYKKVGMDIKDSHLNYYKIETNTTGSVFQIVSKNFMCRWE